jgi:hypothetical protein
VFTGVRESSPGILEGCATPRRIVQTARASPFYVPPLLDILGGLVQHCPRFWLWLGRLESRRLAAELAPVSVRMPVHVCGLARSGSTLLHEIICSHPGVATHRVKDFPLVFTPFWWRSATAGMAPGPPRERPHRDGMMIAAGSPDALEEMLWMAFFPRCHDPGVSHLLGAGDHYPAFEEFYDSHLRKLLLAEGATRYAVKNNYHVARLGYLARLSPDARFLIPVRAPADHVASLLRQHRWFSEGQRKHRRALAFMQRSGHFEFGLDRRPMNLGDGDRVREIQRLWAAGEDVRGLARYWAMVYGHLARLLASDARVRAAARVVRFETLCEAPEQTIRTALDHCELPEAGRLAEEYAATIRSPTSSSRELSQEERAVIQEETGATACLWGY